MLSTPNHGDLPLRVTNSDSSGKRPRRELADSRSDRLAVLMHAISPFQIPVKQVRLNVFELFGGFFDLLANRL